MKKYQQFEFGRKDDVIVFRYVLENDLGYKVAVMNYGATLLAYETPDKNGKFDNIVVSTPIFQEYLGNSPRWGATIGPVGGRIANGTFTLNEKEYILEKNNGNHHLHGGSFGYEQVIFDTVSVSDEAIVFETHQNPSYQGYPGNVVTRVTYRLNELGQMTIEITGISDEETLYNPTNHSYFNLSGNFNIPVEQHKLTIDTDGYTILDDDNIPTGEIDSTNHLVDLLKQGTYLSEIFAQNNEQITARNGIDHGFVLKTSQNQICLLDENSSRKLTISTSAPAVVIYTANGFDEVTTLNNQAPIVHNGVAIEPQVLPDAIHHPQFGNIILSPERPFYWKTVYSPV